MTQHQLSGLLSYEGVYSSQLTLNAAPDRLNIQRMSFYKLSVEVCITSSATKKCFEGKSRENIRIHVNSLLSNLYMLNSAQ